jgi:predicted ATPase
LSIAASQQSVEEPSCRRCLGVGSIVIRQAGGTSARNCVCVKRASRAALLAKVPAFFNSPRLSRLRPRPELHPKQAKVIAFLQANPEESFLLTGKNGTGKSHLAWALYRNAVFKRRPVVACVVRDLIADFRRVEVGVSEGEILKSPRVTPEELRKPGRRWFLFLDEFEKARPSEFAAEQLFNLLDAARSFGHQLVIASNFTPDQLGKHWGRIDPIWGNSIMTRLKDCHEAELF